jgi:hypothetical protein
MNSIYYTYAYIFKGLVILIAFVVQIRSNRR